MASENGIFKQLMLPYLYCVIHSYIFCSLLISNEIALTREQELLLPTKINELTAV